jgi:hypothetical protein
MLVPGMGKTDRLGTGRAPLPEAGWWTESVWILFCVGIAAGLLRIWIRSQRHGLTDANYLIVAVTLVLSAGFGALLASNIVAFG